MSPVLVSAPVDFPVDLAALKLHCAVDSSEWDTLLIALRDAAIGHLDGWNGVLGRAIMPQTWAVEAACAGVVLLPMPDATSAEVDYGEGAVSVDIVASAAGPAVEVEAAGTIAFECGLPASKLPVAVVIIKMLVQHWFAHRGVVGPGAASSEIPMTADSLIQSLRWRRF